MLFVFLFNCRRGMRSRSEAFGSHWRRMVNPKRSWTMWSSRLEWRWQNFFCWTAVFYLHNQRRSERAVTKLTTNWPLSTVWRIPMSRSRWTICIRQSGARRCWWPKVRDCVPVRESDGGAFVFLCTSSSRWIQMHRPIRDLATRCHLQIILCAEDSPASRPAAECCVGCSSQFCVSRLEIV